MKQNNTPFNSEIFKKYCPYKILGLSPNERDIKIITKTYRSLLLKYHPDKNGGNIRKYHLITAAYNEILLRLECIESSEKTHDKLKNDFKNYIADNKITETIVDDTDNAYTDNSGYKDDDFKDYVVNNNYQLKKYDTINNVHTSFTNCLSYEQKEKNFTNVKPIFLNSNTTSFTDYKYAFTDGCYLLESSEDFESIWNKYYMDKYKNIKVDDIKYNDIKYNDILDTKPYSNK